MQGEPICQLRMAMRQWRVGRPLLRVAASAPILPHRSVPLDKSSGPCSNVILASKRSDAYIFAFRLSVQKGL